MGIDVEQYLFVTIDASAMGPAVAGADSEEQAIFLKEFAESVLGFNWAQQCHYIAEELTEKERLVVKQAFERLIEYMEES